MSEFPTAPEAAKAPAPEPQRSALPVPASDATFTRRDLDQIKRDLITVRKDYHEIRNNMVILTHQYSSAPTRSFFLSVGAIWFLMLALLMTFQPYLAEMATRLLSLLPAR